MIPVVSVDQMREVDRLMIEEMEISLPQMMENAGRALATQARRLLGGDVRGQRIVVLAGRGGNGGGGMAAARRLAIWGANVSVLLGQEAEAMRGVPAQQLAILGHVGVPVHGAAQAGVDTQTLAGAALLLDALIGYSLRGAPREPIAALISAANAAGPPVLALDLPSGLDGDTGEPAEPTIKAAATLTLALPKRGLYSPRRAPGWVRCMWRTSRCRRRCIGAWGCRSAPSLRVRTSCLLATQTRGRRRDARRYDTGVRDLRRGVCGDVASAGTREWLVTSRGVLDR
jgi:NAD(P)H-hydrate epimerase